jgi:hypothetical protein
MIARLQSQSESTGEAATLFLSGWLRPGEEAILHRMVTALPRHIRVVRLDLHALEQLDERTIGTMGRLIARWRTERGGTYHLSPTASCECL